MSQYIDNINLIDDSNVNLITEYTEVAIKDLTYGTFFGDYNERLLEVCISLLEINKYLVSKVQQIQNGE